MSAELERLAATCLFPGFAGSGPPDWVRRWLAAGLGGVVLFGRNVVDAQQVRALTEALRAEREDVLIAIDEEGGDVTRLEVAAGSSYPGNYALGAVDDIELTERVATSMGSDLAAAGINLDLAPVADVNRNPRNPVIGIRSFGSEAEVVARHVRAFVTGLQGVGVAACAKHFPGHGDTEQDSHLELATVDAVTQEALSPFRAAIGAGVRSIMTAHVRVRSLGEEPATLSRAILTGLLRDELAFGGLVMTDALEMRAISATVGVEEGAVRALAAGADALCVGHDLDQDVVRGIVGSVVEAVEAGRLAEERLRQAASRVSELAGWGKPSPSDNLSRGVGLEAARRALRAEGDVRLGRAPVVVELRPEASMAAGEARHGFAELLRSLDPATASVSLERARSLPDLGARQLVLVLRDAHRHAWQREAAARLLASAPDAVVVEIGVPGWRPKDGAGYLITHGAGRVNLQAAVERLACSPAGRDRELK